MQQAAGGGGDAADALTGVFVYRVPENTWWWSDEMYRLLGHEPDSVEPTTALFREHRHPDDRERVESALAAVRADGRPFGCYHRITDTSGEEHAVVLVADGRTGDDGSVVTLRGFVIDVTESLVSHARDLAESDVARARVSQQDIDLARGILMAQYGIDADVALRLLRRRSQGTNRKVRDLARELLAAAPTPAGGARQDLSRRVGSVLYARETD
ncbi:PAS and ANTAR domain-containing protein [Streptomyces violaceochromogenes]|uniref:histidine kinase n=1 Tax=Streptomyces violaceochromogenes TaxID=67377 RepID=A0ABU6MDK4_9ACTN|nr:PAS and ANTAR domain-containing protein [Streptomyces violaceochromogenes]MEC7058254.1 PAS and ANTAR domain-containing protein [Streptomyces violaceochromogenes]GHC48904.1 putative transcription antitermination regulator [Streptomyces violaceochromogenes]